MFSELIFLIMLLLIMSFAPEFATQSWPFPHPSSFLMGSSLACFLVATIGLRNIILGPSRKLSLLSHIELIIFMVLFNFLFAPHLFFFPTLSTPNIILSLTIYFGGLWVSYATNNTSIMPHHKFALLKIRFIIPFVIPFLLFELVTDIVAVDSWNLATAIVFPIIFFTAIVIFFPPLLQKLWGCTALPDSPLKKRLLALCKKADFSCKEIKVWNVMKHALTAAIIGISPKTRYVMFTDGILKRFPDDEIEAIFAHEIGHSRHKHLLYYPFILFGMFFAATLFTVFFGEVITEAIGYASLINPTPLWNIAPPLAIFLPHALIIFLYFRFAFGFFSRNFERQADLNVYHVGIDPKHLINALEHVARLSGHSTKEASWHHHSIAERAQFLNNTIDNPSLIAQHHRRVRRMLHGYFLSLIATSALIVTVLTIPINVGTTVSHVINTPIKTQLINHYINMYDIPGDENIIRTTMYNVITTYNASIIPGVIEFYAAFDLAAKGLHEASVILMVHAWQRFDFSLFSDDTLQDFVDVSQYIYLLAHDKNADNTEGMEFLYTMIEKYGEQ